MDNAPWSDDRVSGGETVIFTHAEGEVRYQPENRLDVDPGLLPAIARNSDFGKLYETSLVWFWDRHFEGMRDHNERAYMLRAIAQHATGGLSEAEMRMATGATETERPSNLLVTRFDINGYPANDIVQIKDVNNGSILLYVPNEGGPSFHGFPDDDALHEWVAKQGESAITRDELASRFSTYNRRDGVTDTGAENGLRKIATGEWSKSRINVAQAPINGDIFEAMTNGQRTGDLSDGREAIKSNRQVDQQAMVKKLGWASMLLGPAGLALMPAQIHMNVDLAMHGHTPEERAGATIDAGLAGLDGLMNLVPDSWASKLIGPIVKVGEKIGKKLKPALGKIAGGGAMARAGEIAKDGERIGEAVWLPSAAAAADMRRIRIGAEDFYINKHPNKQGLYELYHVDPRDPNKIMSANQFAVTDQAGRFQRQGLRGGNGDGFDWPEWTEEDLKPMQQSIGMDSSPLPPVTSTYRMPVIGPMRSGGEINQHFAESARMLVHERFKAVQPPAKSGNKLRPDKPADSERLFRASAVVYDLQNQPVVRAGVDYTQVMARGAGNCQEMAGAAAQIIQSSGGQAQMWAVNGHAFTIVGKPPTTATQVGDFAGWPRNVRVTDPWANIECAAADFPALFKSKMQQWAYQGKYIYFDKPGHGPGWYPPNDPDWLAVIDTPKFPIWRAPTHWQPSLQSFVSG
jgi:hypothetical protein